MNMLEQHIQNQQDVACGLEGLLEVLAGERSDLSPCQIDKLLYAAQMLAAQINRSLDAVNLPKGGGA